MDEKLLVSRKSAAAMLGISLPTLDGFLNRRDDPIPHFRVGVKVVIPRAELAEWIKEECARTVPKRDYV